MSGVEFAPIVGSTVPATVRFRDPATRALIDVEEPVFARFRHEDDDSPTPLPVVKTATGTFEGRLTGEKVGWYFVDCVTSGIDRTVAYGQIRFRENAVVAPSP